MKSTIVFLLLSFNAYTDMLPSTQSISDDKAIPSYEGSKVKKDTILPDLSLDDLAVKAKKAFNETVNSEIKKTVTTSPQEKDQQKRIKIAKKQKPSSPPKVRVIGSDGEEKVVTVDESEKIKENQEQVDSIKNPTNDQLVSKQEVVQPQPLNTYDQVSISASAPTRNDSIERSDGIKVFTRNVNNLANKEIDTITLPSGSSAKATMLGGVEMTNEERKIEARLDSLFVGPNGSKVEMNDCIVWMRLKANFNNQRLYGDGYSISCRAETGETFELPIVAHVKGNDSYLGIKGELMANGKMKAALLSGAQEIIGSIGDAFSKVQLNTNAVASGGEYGNTTTTTNVTGSGDKYIMGKAIESVAQNKAANWAVDFYTSLSPTVAVPPGTEIYFSVEGEVQIPKVFFKTYENTNTTSELVGVKNKEIL